MKAAIVSDEIQTLPGQPYSLSLYTKCPTGTSSAIYIPGTAGGDTFRYLTCNDTWAPNQIRFTTGPSATNFNFYVYNRDLYWLRIDDMVLTYADGSVPQQTVLHPGIRNVSTSGTNLVVDGTSYLALGFFDVGYEDLPQAAATGANTITAIGSHVTADCFNTAREGYLDRAYELGLNFVPNLSSTTRLASPDVFPNVIPAYGPHLANLLWFLADEPDQAQVPYWYVPPTSLIAAYQAIKPLSNLPVMADFQRASWSTPLDTLPYLGSTDVWMAEPYGSDFSTVGNAVNVFNSLKRQPIWLAQDDIDAALIVPKAYWAILNGASGIMYFNWDAFKADSTKLAAAKQAFNELGQLHDAIFSADASAQVAAPAGIGSLARTLNGSLYILAANPVATQTSGAFVVPSLQAGAAVTVLFENRTITAVAGGFSDSFAGVSRHVYVIPGPPTPVTVATTVPGLSVTVDGNSCVTPCAFQWPAGSTHTVGINQATQALVAGTQYLFSKWSDGGAPSHSILVPGTSLTLTASFKTQYYLTTIANPAGGGTVFPASGWQDAGAAVPVSAGANYGYQFSSFSGALSGATLPSNLVLNGPAAVTGNFTQSQGRAGWYDSFSNRRKLTINRAQVSGSLSNFPVLISLVDPELKSVSNGGKVTSLNGSDILFTGGDGTTKLNDQVESYDASSGTLVAWVQVPSLSSSSDTVLFLYYGKLAAVDQQNGPGVWDSGYRIVNHFQNSGADSTAYLNSATPGPGASPTAGFIGPGYSVDGISGQLTVPYNASWNGSFSSYTVEFWMKPGSLPDYSAALAIGGWGSPFNIWFYSSGGVNFRMDTASGYCAVGAAVPLDNAFHHLALTYDGSKSQLNAFVDGVGRPYPASCSGNVALPSGPLSIGRFAGGSGVQAVFDELRISAGTPRSQDWIVTGFNSQKSPAAFFTVGASEALGIIAPPPVAVTVTSNPSGLGLTVDGSNCTAPCSFQWIAGSNHTVATASPQAGAGGTQYVFSNWSDGGAQSHSLTTPSASTTFTANFTASSGSGSALPWFGVWTTRRKLTVDRSKISGSLSNFPVLISFSDPELKSIANGGKVGKSDGTDVVFTASDGTTKLNHEIEFFDPLAGKLVAWVQVPSLSPSADTSLFLYYGNAAAADQQNIPNVWDSGYRIVNHFKDSSASDSTQYLNSATPGPGAASTAGFIGQGFAVDGISGQLTVPYNASWNSSFSSYTVEFWMRPGALPDYSGALAIGGWASPFNIWFYSSGSVDFRMDTTGGYCGIGAAVPLDNAFHHLAVTYDASKSQLNAFIDGVGRPYPASCSGNVALPAAALSIGRFAGGSGVQATFDELRVSAGTPRSQDWIVTGINSQKSPATFYTVAASETLGAVAPVAVTVTSTPSGLGLIVDGSNCTAPCSFQWTAGSNHTIATPSPQTASSGISYLFSNWSDGGAQSHSVTAPAASTTFTANFTASSGVPWFGSWTTRRKLTVDHTKVSGPSSLSNFPVLISFSDPELKSVPNGGKVGKPDGTDILFTLSDGTTKLNHELEFFDPLAGKVVAWVQIPSLSPSVDTSLFLYYGNTAAADQQNKPNVWDSGYRIVNHFQNSAADSTAYLNSAIAGPGASSTAGFIGPGYAVDGISGQLTVPYNASWNSSFSSYTVEFWIKPGSLPNYSGALAIGGWASPFNIWFYSSGSVGFRMDTTGGYCGIGAAVPLDNAFHHLAVTYDGSKSQLNAFIDGVERPYPASCSGNVALPAAALSIGRFAGGSGVQATFDELRISAGTPRSQDWIVTGFNSQKSPATFFSVAPSETRP